MKLDHLNKLSTPLHRRYQTQVFFNYIIILNMYIAQGQGQIPQQQGIKFLLQLKGFATSTYTVSFNH